MAGLPRQHAAVATQPDRQLTDDSGISLADFEMLALLSEAPEHRMRMNELADITVTTRSGITRAVKRLIDAGWVRQVKCEEDKRGQFAELTEAGLTRCAPPRPATCRRYAPGCSTR